MPYAVVEYNAPIFREEFTYHENEVPINVATLHNIQDHNHDVTTDFKFEKEFSVCIFLELG